MRHKRLEDPGGAFHHRLFHLHQAEDMHAFASGVVGDGAGEPVAAIARQPMPERLTVLTNSLHTASDFLRHPSRPMVYACGGLLRERSGTFIGREALSFFGKRRATAWSFTGYRVEKDRLADS